MRLIMLMRLPRGKPLSLATLRISRDLLQGRARLRRRGICALQHEQVGCPHLVARGVAGEGGELQRHLRLGQQRRTKGDGDQDDERAAHERALGHGDARLALDHHPIELVLIGARMRARELLDRGGGPRPKVLERPERKVLGHVLRIGPQHAKHRGCLKDSVVLLVRCGAESEAPCARKARRHVSCDGIAVLAVDR